MTGASKTLHTVESVERAFKIIDALRERGGAGVTELSDYLDMSKSGIHKQLTTLVQTGYVVKNDDEYRLGYKFIYDGEHVKRSSSFYNVGAPQVEELARRCEDFTYLAAVGRDAIYSVHTARVENSTATNVQVGDRISPYSSAAGKAVVSVAADEQKEQLFEEEMTQNTPFTTTDRSDVEAELESARKRGVAFEDEENVRGMRGVASPVTSADDEVLGAVAVSGPLSLLEDDRFENDLPELVQQATNIIEMKLSLESRKRQQAGFHVPNEFY